MSAPALHLDFPHRWKAQILTARPLILPYRSFAYPAQAEEVERGALEILITPSAPSGEQHNAAQPFLATCALGFADSAVPSGLWSCPKPEELCAIAGGYAYVVDTTGPDRFSFLSMRPVLSVHAVPAAGLLLFAGQREILAWGANGLAWESAKLSDEGLTITRIEGSSLYGLGWNMRADRETPFVLDLRSGSIADRPGT